jgi:hypothetical protein
MNFSATSCRPSVDSALNNDAEPRKIYQTLLKNLSVAMLAIVSAVCVHASVLWRAPHDEPVPVRGIIETPDKANLQVDTLALPQHVITDSGVVINRRFGETRFGSAGNWIWAQNANPNDVDGVYKRTQRSSWQAFVPCPDLFADSKFIVGAIHCESGSLMRYRGAQVVGRIDPPNGFRIRDIISETQVLLQRNSDESYAFGEIENMDIRLTLLPNVPANSLIRRLAFGRLLDQSKLAIYQTRSGYRTVVFRGTATSLDYTLTLSAAPVPNQQCLSPSFSANPQLFFFSIERQGAQKWLRIYDLGSVIRFRRQEQLADSDELLCTNGNVAHVISQRANGDLLSRIGAAASSPGMTVTHPLAGPAQLYVVGRTAVAQFVDQSIRLFDADQNVLGSALTGARATPYWISSDSAFGSPLREVFTRVNSETDAVQIVVQSRDHASGASIATQVWETGFVQSIDQVSLSPQLLNTPGAVVFSVSTLDGVATKSTRSTRLLVPAPAANTLQPLRDQAGFVAKLARVAVAGLSIYGQSNPDAAGVAQLYRWSFSGQFLAQSTISAAAMYGQANGHVLLSDLTSADRQLRMHDGSAELWQRPLLSCGTLPLDNFPALDCPVNVGTAALSTIIKLDASTGNQIWARTISPLDVTESWRARSAWLRQGQLVLVSWTNGFYQFGSPQRLGHFSAARVDANTGALLSVGPSLSAPVQSINLEARDRYPFTDDWLRFSASNPLFEPDRRRRFALRIGQAGELSSTLLGLSESTGVGFSENYLYSSTNDGPRWYATDGITFEYQSVARSFPEPVITQPLTLDIEQHLNLNLPSENANAVRIVVRNSNATAARGARLHTGNIDCPAVDAEKQSVLIDVPANSALILDCTAWAQPASSIRQIFVFMRQPMNFSGLQSVTSTALGVTLQSPFQNGFED